MPGLDVGVLQAGLVRPLVGYPLLRPSRLTKAEPSLCRLLG